MTSVLKEGKAGRSLGEFQTANPYLPQSFFFPSMQSGEELGRQKSDKARSILPTLTHFSISGGSNC